MTGKVVGGGWPEDPDRGNPAWDGTRGQQGTWVEAGVQWRPRPQGGGCPAMEKVAGGPAGGNALPGALGGRTLWGNLGGGQLGLRRQLVGLWGWFIGGRGAAGGSR